VRLLLKVIDDNKKTNICIFKLTIDVFKLTMWQLMGCGSLVTKIFSFTRPQEGRF